MVDDFPVIVAVLVTEPEVEVRLLGVGDGAAAADEGHHEEKGIVDLAPDHPGVGEALR